MRLPVYKVRSQKSEKAGSHSNVIPAEAGISCRDSRVSGNLSSGFTLVEIMLVVIIIAALAAMIMPRLTGRSEEAKRARAQVEISSNIGLALKLYELDNGNYPTTEQGLNALMTAPSTNPTPQNWKGPYLEKKPVDPWGRPYQYKSPGVHSPTGYDLYSLGKDGTEGNEDDVVNWE